MAATQTLPHPPHHCNFTPIKPEYGVITLFGYGINVHVDRGHLCMRDGIGVVRRQGRFARVGHGIRRLVVIGADGMVSLAALRWLADQDASFIMLERDGSVLATTGPVRPSDARLRRAQALASHSGAALEIARELIIRKLDAQEKVARVSLQDETVAQLISQIRPGIATAQSIGAIRLLESRAARFYWGAWRDRAINFSKSDLHRVPEHWRVFGTRFSPLTGSPRLAANPANAMLNYLYALLESETRLAISALGLDPGLGVLHTDSPAHDSLACDVMEPIRPQVDRYVLEWISRETLRREWFFEQRDGNCRLMGSFAGRLSETAATWSGAVAPIAEWVAQALWLTIRKASSKPRLATRLTQLHRCEVKGVLPASPSKAPRPESFCRVCTIAIPRGRTYCASCSMTLTTAGLIKAAVKGRVAAQSDQAQAHRGKTQQGHATARYAWKESMNPEWLTKETYENEIQSRLPSLTLSVLASKLGISISYAVDIRKGRRIPHSRHWQVLAQLVGVSRDE
ncbi:MAG: CRISPR-associated endonuclease Cas1 [Candidatus Acidiferrales bacterium]